MVEPIDIRTGKPFASRRCHEHHPPSDGASLGGGWGRARGLMGGAFMGCMMAQQGAPSPTTRNYVLDGLVTMFDGIENAGIGRHSTSITNWANLAASNADYALNGLYSYTIGSDNMLVVSKGTYEEESYIDLPNVASDTEFTIECCVSPITRATADNFTFIIGNHHCSISDTYNGGRLVYVFGRYDKNKRMYKYTQMNPSGILTLTSATDGAAKINANGVSVYYNWNSTISRAKTRFYIMWGSISYRISFKLYNMRLYNRVLTAAEITQNYNNDVARFGLP